MKNLFLYKLIGILTAILFITQNIFPIPLNNRYDPVAIYNVFGTDKYYTPKKSWGCSLQLSPFYQHSAGARNGDGRKVPEGDIFGRWNMCGLFYGILEHPTNNASPAAKKFSLEEKEISSIKNYYPDTETITRYKNLSSAWRVLDNLNEDAKDNPDYNTTNLAKNYTDQTKFDTNNFNDGFLSVPLKYEKMGLRGELNFDIVCGFGFKVKSGIIDYKQRPTFNDQTALEADKVLIQKYLTGKYQDITQEIGLDIKEYKATTFEDTHVEFYWNLPFDVKNNENEVAVRLVPYFSIGGWLPSGKEQDTNKAFSLPTGNDGHWAITAETNINLDFPGLVQFGFGGGAAVFASKDSSNYRVPSSLYQFGIYPWAVNISRDPGVVWYANASFKAKEFIDNFSFFFDYIHTEHLKDSITITETSRKDLFYPTKLEEESKWKDNTVHLGLNYSIAPGFEMGMAVIAHISGTRVYRNTTILGTFTFNY